MCGVITTVNTIIISDLQCRYRSVSSNSITVHCDLSYGILLSEGYDMIRCIRCHDDTTLDYIATGTIAEPVCMDCVTADEQDQLDTQHLPKEQGARW